MAPSGSGRELPALTSGSRAQRSSILFAVQRDRHHGKSHRATDDAELRRQRLARGFNDLQPRSDFDNRPDVRICPGACSRCRVDARTVERGCKEERGRRAVRSDHRAAHGHPERSRLSGHARTMSSCRRHQALPAPGLVSGHRNLPPSDSPRPRWVRRAGGRGSRQQEPSTRGEACGRSRSPEDSISRPALTSHAPIRCRLNSRAATEPQTYYCAEFIAAR